jgi:hypothetical protein
MLGGDSEVMPIYTKNFREEKPMRQFFSLLFVLMLLPGMPATAQESEKPNIILIVSDDTGYGDLGPYGGGEGRGMPTPSIDYSGPQI